MFLKKPNQHHMLTLCNVGTIAQWHLLHHRSNRTYMSFGMFKKIGADGAQNRLASYDLMLS